MPPPNGYVLLDQEQSDQQADTSLSPKDVKPPKGYQILSSPKRDSKPNNVSSYAKPGPYVTKLSSDQEKQFQLWVKDKKVPWQDTPTADYDMRGYWQAMLQGKAKESLNKNDKRMHFPDTWKTPYHKSFSNESMYATADAPRWINDHQLADKNGKVVFDEKEVVKSPREIKKMVSGTKPPNPPNGYFVTNPAADFLPAADNKEGLYEMFGRVLATPQNPQGIGPIKVPYSKVPAALKAGYTWHGEGVENTYNADKASEGKKPSKLGMLDQWIQSKIAPVPHQTQQHLLEGQLSNTDRTFLRTLYSLPGFGRDLWTAYTQSLKTGNANELVNLVDPTEQAAGMYKQFKQDYASDPKMAVDNLIGTVAGLAVAGKVIHKAGEIATQAPDLINKGIDKTLEKVVTVDQNAVDRANAQATGRPIPPRVQPPRKGATQVKYRGPLGEVRHIPGEAPVVWLSPQGWESLFGIIYPQEYPHGTPGINLPAEKVQALVNDKTLTSTPEFLAQRPWWNAQHQKNFEELQKTLGAATTTADQGGIVMGAKRTGLTTPEGKPRNISATVQVRREELNHTWQRKLGEGDWKNHLPQGQFSVLNSMIPKGMADYLEHNGYDPQKPAEMVTEAAAKMMGNRLSEYGVTPEQAADFLHEYFTRIVAEHGVKALESLNHVTGIGRAIKEAVEREHSGLAERAAGNKPVSDVAEGREGGITGGDQSQPIAAGPEGQVAEDELERARRRAIITEDQALRNRDKEAGRPVWFLKSDRLIGQKMKGPMPASEVANMLRNGGIRADEMKWTGLDDFLAQKGKEKVTPEEIRKHIAENAIRIEEVNRGDKLTKAKEVQPNDLELTIDTHQYSAANPTTGRISSVGKGVVASPEEARIYLAHLFNHENVASGAVQGDLPKYGNWQLVGGSNYRELLLTMPYRENLRLVELGSQINEIENRIAKATQNSRNIVDNDYVAKEKFYNEIADLNNTRDALILEERQLKESGPQYYQSPHWEEPNPLAHVRFNDRTTPDGQRLLHVEEIQSDWAQRGRKSGYYPASSELAQAKAKIIAAREKMKAINDDVRTALDGMNILGFDTFGEAKNAIAEHPDWAERWDVPAGSERDLLAKWREAKLEFEEADKQHNALISNASQRVPDMPWKTDWHEASLRRVLKYAADNGYYAVSWTGGADQAERYDLSKQIESVSYTPNDPESHSGWLTATDKNGKRVIDEEIERDDLPDYIGKEASQKLMEKVKEWRSNTETGLTVHEDEKTGKYHLQDYYGEPVYDYGGTELEFNSKDDAADYLEYKANEQVRSLPSPELRGLDLKVGGEGMHGFYDKIVPEYLNKFGKKFGAKVGMLKDVGAESLDSIENLKKDMEDKEKKFDEAKDEFRTFEPRDPMSDLYNQKFDEVKKTQEEWQDARDKYKEAVTRPTHDFQSIPITPEMRGVLREEGVALFHREAPQLRKDNPGGEWLEKKRKQTLDDGRDTWGGFNRIGVVTGTYDDSYQMVPVDVLRSIPGAMGEKPFLRDTDRAESMAENFRKTGRLPQVKGKDYAPFIMVDQEGKPWVNEGNHRIAGAALAGVKYLPVEVRYFNGGEQEKGVMSPENITSYHQKAMDEGYTPEHYAEKTKDDAELRYRDAPENAWKKSQREYAGEWDADESTWDERHRKEQEWDQSVLGALSTGKLSPEDAYKREMHVQPPAGEFKPLPKTLYHVTTAAGDITTDRIRSRWEAEHGKGKGLGGGHDMSISFTTDLETARAIESSMKFAQQVAAGHITLQDIASMAERHEGAPKPFFEEFKKGFEGMTGSLENSLRGVTIDYHAGSPPNNPWDAPEVQASWHPVPTGFHWTGGDGIERYGLWERSLTEKEKSERAWYAMQSFLRNREHAGGLIDPLFFTTDTAALAKVKPEDIKLLEFKPEKGGMGTKESGMDEWRTYSGKAVKFVGEVKPDDVLRNREPIKPYKQLDRMDPEAAIGEPYSAAIITGDGKIHIGEWHDEVMQEAGLSGYTELYEKGGVKIRPAHHEVNIEFGKMDDKIVDRVRRVIASFPDGQFTVEFTPLNTNEPYRQVSGGADLVNLSLDRWIRTNEAGPAPGSAGAWHQRGDEELFRREKPTIPEALKDTAGRVVDTTDKEQQEQDLGRAGYVRDGEVISYHVTDHPERVREYLESGKPIYEGGSGADKGIHRELGPGLYASDVPHYWTSRSTGKYDFLDKMTPEQGDALANAIQKEIDGSPAGYLSSGEKESAHRYLDQFRKDRYGSALTLLADQPYNIQFWKPYFLKAVGVEPSKQPEVIEVRAKGNFVEAKRYLHPDEWKSLRDAGFDGVWIRGGFSADPQLVIWNRDAITKFGDWTQDNALRNREQINTPEFKEWFRESKAVDDDGKPLVLYHGTPRKNPTVLSPHHAMEVAGAVFFTDNEDVADEYRYEREYGEIVGEHPGKLVKAYLSIQNPMIVDMEGSVGDAIELGKLVREAKEKGHDGLILKNVDDTVGSTGSGEDTTYAIFNARQVKSAVGNSGTFDPNDPNILRNREKPLVSDSDIEHWTGYTRSLDFKTPDEARQWLFEKLERSDKEQWAEMFGKNGPEKNKAISESMPLYRDGRKWKIGRKEKPVVSKERLGAEEPDGKAPSVAWEKQDLQDSDNRVTPETILRDYNSPRTRKAIVYRSYVPTSEMPEEKLVEEEYDDEEDRTTYPWEELQGRGTPPPIKLLVKPNGEKVILDGNHRVRFWSESGYDSIPAWVIDQRRGIKVDEEDDDALRNREKVNDRTYYRGSVLGSTEKIKTGVEPWDSYLFVSDDPKQASSYGSHLTTFRFKPNAKILEEGTWDFNKLGRPRKNENLLDFSNRITQKAKESGYDAVHFQLQGTVGTAVMNRDAIKEVGNKQETPSAAGHGKDHYLSGDKTDEVANEVKNRLESEGYRVFPIKKGNTGGSNYLNVFKWGSNAPEDGTTLRFATHPANIGGNYINEYTGRRWDENDVANYDQAKAILEKREIKPKLKDDSAAGQTTPSNDIPVQGGTIIAGAPKQETPVPIPPVIAAPVPPKQNEVPKGKVASVRELLARARMLKETKIVP